MSTAKSDLRLARKRRIRARVVGTSTRPRLTVYCSLSAIAAQVIDDSAGTTLASVSKKGKNVAAAVTAGNEIAKNARAAGITSVVFDRNGRKYHGRIKALADAAREGGLSF